MWSTINFLAYSMVIISMLAPCMDKPKLQIARVVIFVLVAAVSLWPHVEYYWEDSPYIMKIPLSLWVNVFGFYIIGIIFFVSFIPERCSPGNFDFLVQATRFGIALFC